MSATTSWRSFIGIGAADMGLSDSLAQRMAAYAAEQRFGGIRWTPEHFLHLTLVFFGNQTPALLAAYQLALDQWLPQTPGFPIRMNCCAAFPDAKSRIVAALPELSEPLAALQSQLVRVAHTLEIAVDERRFVPHITLGRVGKGKSLAPFNETMELSGKALAISLYRSEIVPGGSHYSVIKRWPLTTV